MSEGATHLPLPVQVARDTVEKHARADLALCAARLAGNALQRAEHLLSERAHASISTYAMSYCYCHLLYLVFKSTLTVHQPHDFQTRHYTIVQTYKV
jgi:hypothetical protein